MREFLAEFRKFVMRGNLIEIAVAFILGLYFKAVVDAFVQGIVMQFIAAIFGKRDFATLTIGIGKSKLFVGAFINQVITFVIVAFVLFLFIKAYEHARDMARREHPEEVAPLSREGEVLVEIRDLLRAQSH